MKRNRKTAEMKKEKLMRVALVIGHKSSSGGAVNPSTGVSEFIYNEQVVALVHNEMAKHAHVDVVYRGTYSHLPDKINNLRPDYVVSFHCNAYNTKVSGTEVLYYHKSKKGKWLAQQFQDALLNCFKFNDRGIKSKTSEDRGGYLLRYTDAPCVILEPFFIDNDFEYALGISKMEDYANTVVDVLRNLHDGTS